MFVVPADVIPEGVALVGSWGGKGSLEITSHPYLISDSWLLLFGNEKMFLQNISMEEHRRIVDYVYYSKKRRCYLKAVDTIGIC